MLTPETEKCPAGRVATSPAYGIINLLAVAAHGSAVVPLKQAEQTSNFGVASATSHDLQDVSVQKSQLTLPVARTVFPNPNGQAVAVGNLS